MTYYWFISTKYRRNPKLALLTFLLAFVVIIMGAYTRLTDAGLSCPDWPYCYGFITAPHTLEQVKEAASQYPLTPVNMKKAWTEMTHRYFVLIESILILSLAGTILSTRIKTLRSYISGCTLISLLALQVLLGMLTVTIKLEPFVVLAHLITGITILSVLWWTYLDIQLKHHYFIKKNYETRSFWLGIGFTLVLVQIALGGVMSTHYAGLACIDLPYCNGELLPVLHWSNLFTDPKSVHMLHRIGALVTAIYLSFLTLALIKNRSTRALATLMLSLLALQVTLGVLNIIWLRPVWVALLHHIVGITLLMTLIYAIVRNSYQMDSSCR